MIKYIEHLIVENWSTWFPVSSLPKHFYFMASARKHTMLFIFADNSSQPILLVKIPRSEWGKTYLQHEHTYLQKISSMLSPELGATLPRPLLLTKLGNDLIGLEKVLPGYPIESKRSRTNGLQKDNRLAQRYQETAQDWLLALHKQTTTARVPFGQPDILSEALSPLETLKDFYELSPQEYRLINRLQDQAAGLSDQTLPLTCQHGDFWTGNILWNDYQIGGIVDWENSKLEALPFLDLFLFTLDTGGLSSNHTSPQQNRFIQTYFKDMEINERFINLFWPISLATMATRKCSIRAGDPTPTDQYFRGIFAQYTKEFDKAKP